MHRCSLALRAGLLLCIAGLMGENLLIAAGTENSTATDLTPNSSTGVSDNNFIIAINTSSVNSTAANARIETVPTSGATVTPQSFTGSPTSQHEFSSSSFITPNSSASTHSNDGVSSTGLPKNTSTEFTTQMSQAPHTINSTGSPTPNSTAVTSKLTNATATHIQNSQTPSSPESFSTNTGITQTTGATTVKSTSNSINSSTEFSHPTVAVSPTVLTTLHGNLVSTVPQGPTVATAQTVAAANTKNTSPTPNTATASVKEASTALSSGSIAAITVTVIFFVLVIFGGAAYLKIRHSSYGRLVDDHDYGSWGNYNNPLYDDS